MKTHSNLIFHSLFVGLACLSLTSIAEQTPSGKAFCQYESPPRLVQPTGSLACGESKKDGAHICVAEIKCSMPDGTLRSGVGACDAMPDGTCPGPEMCANDTALSIVGHAQVAKDDAVTEFWGKREDIMEHRRRAAKLSDTEVSSTPAPTAASRLSNAGPAATSHKQSGKGTGTGRAGNTRGLR
jgi:hypothetical protein